MTTETTTAAPAMTGPSNIGPLLFAAGNRTTEYDLSEGGAQAGGAFDPTKMDAPSRYGWLSPVPTGLGPVDGEGDDPDLTPLYQKRNWPFPVSQVDTNDMQFVTGAVQWLDAQLGVPYVPFPTAPVNPPADPPTPTPAPAPVPATTQPLLPGRFTVTANWMSVGEIGPGTAIPFPGGCAVHFTFFDAARPEIEIEIIDGRSVNGHFWVFASGSTNVGVSWTVTDTTTGNKVSGTSPEGTTFVAVQNLTAF